MRCTHRPGGLKGLFSAQQCPPLLGTVYLYKKLQYYIQNMKRDFERSPDIFPPDEDITDEEVDAILDRTSHLGPRIISFTAGSAVILAAAAEIWRRYRPTPPIED